MINCNDFGKQFVGLSVPGLAGWPDKNDYPKQVLHLNMKTKMIGGRDYIIAESQEGNIWVCHGRASGVRKGGGVKEFWLAKHKDFSTLLDIRLRWGYQVVGEMLPDGRWESDKYTYNRVKLPLKKRNSCQLLQSI